MTKRPVGCSTGFTCGGAEHLVEPAGLTCGLWQHPARRKVIDEIVASDELRGEITQRHHRHAAVAATREVARQATVTSEPRGKCRLADAGIGPDQEVAAIMISHEPVDEIDQPLTAHELVYADLVEHWRRIEPHVPQASELPGEHVTGDDVALARDHP